MKRLGNLWPHIVDFNNLLLAFRRARRGKRRRPDVANFELRLESELLSLQEQLQDGSYQPGAYRLFTIYERKPRLIAAAPFRDRIVHHALMNVIEPPLDRRFIFDSYACRTGKGIHAAVDRYQTWAKHYRYALKMDVSRYFPNVDHELLKTKLRRLIKDVKVLALLDRIIEHSPIDNSDESVVYFPGDDLLTPFERRRGLPIGNLTSQFFANLYLNDFDHWIKESLNIKPYLRYVDDMVILSNDKSELADIRRQVSRMLERERLCLHPKKAHIMPVSGGLDVLGYRVFPDRRLLRNDNGWRFIRKLKNFAAQYAEGRVAWEDFNPAVQSWIGHASHADTFGLRAAIFSRIIFRRGANHTAASA